jgi:hemin uptake protein HemP
MPARPSDRPPSLPVTCGDETATDPATPPRYRAEALFAGARQLIIVHGGREYCLRLTAANKLILTA